MFIPIGLGVGSVIGCVLPDTIGQVMQLVRYLDMYPANLLILALLVIIQAIFTVLVIKDHRMPQL